MVDSEEMVVCAGGDGETVIKAGIEVRVDGEIDIETGGGGETGIKTDGIKSGIDSDSDGGGDRLGNKVSTTPR